MARCPECNREIDEKNAICPYCELATGFRCPECGSSDVSLISGFEKGCLFLLLGVIFALIFVRKTLFNKYECNVCHHKFS